MASIHPLRTRTGMFATPLKIAAAVAVLGVVALMTGGPLFAKHEAPVAISSASSPATNAAPTSFDYFPSHYVVSSTRSDETQSPTF